MAKKHTIDEIGALALRFQQERLASGRALEIDQESASRPNRRILMARRVRAPRRGAYGEPVYTWAFASSQPRGGIVIQYETRLEEDGVLRCNCPGWIFCNGKPADKTCKHKKIVVLEAPDILRRWQNGETLPLLGMEGPATARVSSRPPEEGHSKARFGRLIELDG